MLPDPLAERLARSGVVAVVTVENPEEAAPIARALLAAKPAPRLHLVVRKPPAEAPRHAQVLLVDYEFVPNGFDADDTLWHSEGFYREVHGHFETILG